MSILPEFIFKNLITLGIRAMRKEPKILRQLLWNLPRDSVSEFTEEFIHKGVSVETQFPREDIIPPLIVITLGRETESRGYLADVLEDPRFPAGCFSYDRNEETAEETLSTVGLSPNIIGDPPSLYDSKDFVERRGSTYKETYNIHIVENRPENTILLYSIVKAILQKNRQVLEKNGVRNMVLGGSDMVYNKELLPSHVFARILEAKFDYEFDLYLPVPTFESLEFEVDVCGTVVTTTVELEP